MEQDAPQANATAVIPPVAAEPGYAPPVVPVPGFVPPAAPVAGGPKKSKSGLIIGLVIAAVVILGILGGGLAFAISKGYGWLPDNLTRKARAEATVDVVEAFATQDFSEFGDISTGDLKDLLKKYEDELDGGDPLDVKISKKEWDGDELTFEIEIEDEKSDVTIEPDDSSTDVKVAMEGNNGAEFDVELAYDDGWKITDVNYDGTSFVEELSGEFDSSDEGGSSEDDESYYEDDSEDSDYSEDEEYSDEDSYDELDDEQAECFDNQIDIESGASESSSDYEDLAGTVDDEHPLVVDDGWLDEAPSCPTTGDYYELDSDGVVYGCPEHGYYADYDY